MTQKEIFLLTIIFQKLGLNKKEISKLITTCTAKGDTYNTIINAINKLEGYFIGERKYDKQTLCHILKEGRIYGCGIDKIKRVEDTFKMHDYTSEEIKIIETIHPTILCHEINGLDKKLLFYNDIKVKNLIIENPKHLMQGLKLSYARYQFFSEKGLDEKDIFLNETRFINAYGLKNKTLIIKYPINNPAYLSKK